jgi:hypothetical protein
VATSALLSTALAACALALPVAIQVGYEIAARLKDAVDLDSVRRGLAGVPQGLELGRLPGWVRTR